MDEKPSKSSSLEYKAELLYLPKTGVIRDGVKDAQCLVAANNNASLRLVILRKIQCQLVIALELMRKRRAAK